jgi:hypothetical protein
MAIVKRTSFNLVDAWYLLVEIPQRMSPLFWSWRTAILVERPEPVHWCLFRAGIDGGVAHRYGLVTRKSSKPKVMGTLVELM